MENANMMLLISTIASFFLGVAISTLSYYFLTNTGRTNRKLMKKLNTIENEFQLHQQKVTDHFDATSGLMNQLTNTYKEVQTHLAVGAESLCQDKTVQDKLGANLLSSNALLSSGTNGTMRRKYPPPSEQPRDYATKKIEESSTLSEEFNVKDCKTTTKNIDKPHLKTY